MKIRHLSYMLIATASLILNASPVSAASHANENTVIEVTAKAEGGTLSEALADKIRSRPGVERVEKYLLLPGLQFDRIGIEPGASIRIYSDDGQLITGQIEFGRDFRETDAERNVALVNGVSIGSQEMTGMVHSLGVGQSFALGDERFRVIGEVGSPTEGKLFFPLETLQDVSGEGGVVTQFFVIVAENAEADAVRNAVMDALGPTVRTTLR